MNFIGLFLGIAALIIIGLGFLWVIRAEYHLGYLWWPYFLGLGIMLVIGSLLVPSVWGSAILGILGASIIWGSTEFTTQAVRTELGWYPFNQQPRPDPPFVGKIKRWPSPRL